MHVVLTVPVKLVCTFGSHTLSVGDKAKEYLRRTLTGSVARFTSFSAGSSVSLQNESIVRIVFHEMRLTQTQSSYKGEITKRNQHVKPMRTQSRFANEKDLKTLVVRSQLVLVFHRLLQKQQD